MSMESSDNRKPHKYISPAGVEWSARTETNISGEEAYNLESHAQARMSATTEQWSEKAKMELAANRAKIHEYLISQGIDAVAANKALNVPIGQLSPDQMRPGIGLRLGSWDPLTESVDITKTSDAIGIAHELVHVTAKNKFHLQSNIEGKAPVIAQRSGLESRVQMNNKRRSFFHLLNEGLTEEVALRALGRSDEKAADWMKLFRTIMDSIGRGGALRGDALDDSDKVLKALLQSAVYGWSSELKKSINDTFGSEALRILSDLDMSYYDLFMDRDSLSEDFVKLADENQLFDLTKDIPLYFSSTHKEHEELGKSIWSRMQIMRAF